MSDPEPTRIGIVRQVLGSEVIVELDDALAGVSPVFEGNLMPIGQIGSLVRIPQGLVDLIATVTLLGIGAPAEGEGDDPLGGVGKRWLKVQLLGQIDRGTSRFERGVGTYPGLDDPVHFARPTDLSVVFPKPDQSHVRVGRLSASESVLVTLDLGKLVMRHSAVVGSTGSGKTSAVASVLQAIAGGGWDAANIVVIDPHGEYATAFGDRASVRSVFGNGPNRLAVPYWALPAADILFAFTGVTAGATTIRDFAGLVTEARKRFAAAAKWLHVEQAAITSDTPIPFDLRWVWHELDYRNRETRRTKADPTSAAVVAQGDPENLVPTTFEPYGPAGQSPHQAPNYDVYGSAPELLRLGIQDPRLAFLLGPEARDEGPDPLEIGLSEWLGGERPVSVLDFSGVPEEAAELAIGVILHLLFETATRTNYGEPGIGRPRPVLVVLEEAHRY